jgi:hypothetical protein
MTPLVSFPVVGIKGGVLPIKGRSPAPPSACAAARAVADIKSDDLSTLSIEGDPDPLLVGLASNETPQLIGLRLKSEPFHTAIESPR